MAKKDYKVMAESILEGMGGKDNVSFCSICMTRLRATVKDKGFVSEEKLKEIPGVVGVQWFGEQLQIIVGTDVKKVFDEIQKNADFEVRIEEETKREFNFKDLPGIILDYISGSVTQIIPVLQVASMAIAIRTILGPNILNALPEDNGFMVFLNLVYNTGFYFFPVFLGYSSAKKLNLSPLYGLFLGTVLITPDLLSAVENGTVIKLLGMNVPLVNYTQSVFPVLLCMPLIKLFSYLCDKYLPSVVSNSFGSTITFLVGLPLCLLFIAPLGNLFAQWFGGIVNWIANNLGILGGAIGGGLWFFIVMAGAHMVLIPTMIGNLMSTGMETLIMPASFCCYQALLGVELAALLRIKDKKEKANIMTYCISDWIGNVSEPALFGLCLKFKKSLPALIIGGAVGGALTKMLNLAVYGMVPGIHIIEMWTALGSLGGDNPRLNWGLTIAMRAVSFVVSFLIAYFYSFKETKIKKEA